MQKQRITHMFCWVPAAWSAVRGQSRRDPEDGPVAACDVPKIHDGVTKLYARVATDPHGEFHFHRGADYASTLLNYDRTELGAIPATSTDSFAGVGNPHIIDVVRPGEVVLDVGSGAGTDLLLAARQVGAGGRAIGVEMTTEMLERCRSSITESGLQHVEVRQGDAEHLPIADDSIDAVISNGVLSLVPNKERALREISRVLRPGGRLLLADIALTSRLGRMLSSSVDLWALCVGGALREEEFIDLLTTVGFQDVRTTHRFDCIKGTSGEFLARRLGVRSINLYAKKPETEEFRSASGLATVERVLGQ
jgi:arsenite methyltransferase